MLGICSKVLIVNNNNIMAHKHVTPSLDESFDFSPALRKKLIISAIIGIAMVALGAFLIKNHWKIKNSSTSKHFRHIGDIGSIPITNISIKTDCFFKHF